MTHPSPDTLVPFAFGVEDAATARHLERCATCRGEIEWLREATRFVRTPALAERRAETPECLDEVTVAAFVEGLLGPDDRAPVVAHLIACARCRSVVQAAGQAVAEVRSEASGRRWRRRYLPLGAAAAAAILVFLWPRLADDLGVSPVLREPADTGAVPLLISPRASVPQAHRFVWSQVPRVVQYRMRLYAEDGTVRWTVETSDTVALLPENVVLTAGGTYLWKVEAQTEWQRWSASPLVEFRIGEGRR